MSFHRHLFGLLLVALLSSCHLGEVNSSHLTPTQLRVEGDSFDGLEVVVRGWITLETENANLWTDKADMKQGRTIHCISLYGYDRLLQKKEELNRSFVEVRGVFRKDVVGNTGTVRFAACNRSAIEPLTVKRL